MYEFLGPVGDDVLRAALRRQLSEDSRLLVDKLSRKSILQALFSAHGYDLLHERSLRLEFFSSLPLEILNTLALSSKVEAAVKPYDTAVRLASLPWRAGSGVVRAIAEQLDVPRDYLPSSADRQLAVISIEPFDPAPSLFDYQEEVIISTLNIIQADGGTCLVQLPTGAGKTRTAMEAVAELLTALGSDNSTLVVWLAHTEELCEQAIGAFENVWRTRGDFEVQVARMWGRYSPDLSEVGTGLLVSGFQKLATFGEHIPESLVRRTALVVVDEAHKAIAPTYRRAIEQLTARGASLLGLTATPGRGAFNDLENRRLSKMFGQQKVTARSLSTNPIVTLKKRGILANLEVVVIPTGVTVEESEGGTEETVDVPAMVLRKLAKSTPRNSLIIDVVRDEVAHERPCVVFACGVAHARELSLMAAAQGVRAAFVDGTIRRSRRRHIVRELRAGNLDVVFNFGVLSTGFDAPNIQTVIIARPTSSIVLYSQMIGRALRGPKVGGAEQCRLVDFRDNYETFGGVEEVYSYFDSYWS